MHAETAQRFAALEALAGKLRTLFGEAGFEPVAPAILQPADILLDCLGEALRARTYVFNDLDGEELCLRPDLTVPTARLYLERNPVVLDEARYCYNGPTFRYSPAAPIGKQSRKNIRPREFRQMGLEIYASSDILATETEILKLTVEALEEAGLVDYQIRIGDLGLFAAILDALDMPERWRARLKHHFWRPDSFHKLLHDLADEKGASRQRTGDWPRLDPEDPAAAKQVIADYLTAHNIPLVGSRTLDEITKRLIDFELDAGEQPLSAQNVQLIEDYLAIDHQPNAVIARLEDLTSNAKISIKPALKRYKKRLEMFKSKGLDLKNAKFTAEFGRDFEYYTGFVFQIEVEDMPEIGPLAGGGRYDHLLHKLGAMEDVPAVGCAIHTERLLTVVEGDMS